MTRWHIVATAKRQSLAEHSFNVAMIAGYICDEIGEVSPARKRRIMYFALHHDIDEVIYGDIPSPAKKPDMPRLEVLDDRVLKLADLLDMYTFIRANAVDRHGRQVVQYCDNLLKEFLKHHPELAGIATHIIESILEERYEM